MQLDFVSQTVGSAKHKLYFICDSYLGADQEFDFTFKVLGMILFFTFKNQNVSESRGRKRRHDD